MLIARLGGDATEHRRHRIKPGRILYTLVLTRSVANAFVPRGINRCQQYATLCT